MTLFDVIVVGVLMVSSALAFMRGFANEVLSVLAWVVAAIAALYLFPLLTPVIRTAITTEWLAAVISAIAIFVIVYLLVAGATHRWADRLMALHDHAQLLDRSLGLLFGLARGLLIVTVAYLFFAWLVPNPTDQPDWIRNAKLKPLVEGSAETLFSLAPAQSPKIFEQSPQIQLPKPPSKQQEAPPPASAPAAQPSTEPQNSGADTDEAPGYNSSERKGLDRLFENTTGQ